MHADTSNYSNVKWCARQRKEIGASGDGVSVMLRVLRQNPHSRDEIHSRGRLKVGPVVRSARREGSAHGGGDVRPGREAG